MRTAGRGPAWARHRAPRRPRRRPRSPPRTRSPGANRHRADRAAKRRGHHLARHQRGDVDRHAGSTPVRVGGGGEHVHAGRVGERRCATDQGRRAERDREPLGGGEHGARQREQEPCPGQPDGWHDGVGEPSRGQIREQAAEPERGRQQADLARGQRQVAADVGQQRNPREGRDGDREDDRCHDRHRGFAAEPGHRAHCRRSTEAEGDRADGVDPVGDRVPGRHADRGHDRSADHDLAGTQRCSELAEQIRDVADQADEFAGGGLGIGNRPLIAVVSHRGPQAGELRRFDVRLPGENHVPVEDVAGEDLDDVGGRRVDVDELERRGDRRDGAGRLGAVTAGGRSAPSRTATSGSTTGRVQSSIRGRRRRQRRTVGEEADQGSGDPKPSIASADPKPSFQPSDVAPGEAPLANGELRLHPPAHARVGGEVSRPRAAHTRRRPASPRRASPRSAVPPRRRCCRSRASGRRA